MLLARPKEGSHLCIKAATPKYGDNGLSFDYGPLKNIYCVSHEMIEFQEVHQNLRESSASLSQKINFSEGKIPSRNPPIINAKTIFDRFPRKSARVMKQPTRVFHLSPIGSFSKVFSGTFYAEKRQFCKSEKSQHPR